MEVAESTGNFVIEQAPELLQEFYRWHIAKSIFGIVTFGLLILLVYWFFRFCGKKKEQGYHNTLMLGRYYETDEMPFFILCFFIGIAVLIFPIAMLTNIYNLVFILVAPKLYLIEHFIN